MKYMQQWKLLNLQKKKHLLMNHGITVYKIVGCRYGSQSLLYIQEAPDALPDSYIMLYVLHKNVKVVVRPRDDLLFTLLSYL
jgi:hypothetical protein